MTDTRSREARGEWRTTVRRGPARLPVVRLASLWMVAVMCGLSALDATLATLSAAPPAPVATEERLARLIRELGSEQYLIRERAQAELERIGVTAFDALDEARDSEDVEVALRVRYLLRMLSANWSQEEDPPEVKAVLKGYGEQLESERKTRMERLAAYGHLRAQSALCRLARFETSPVLAKEAALLVMSTAPPVNAEGEQALAVAIRQVIGNSRRTSTSWLRLYAATLEAPPEQLASWQQAVDAEVVEFDTHSARTSATLVRDLLRWQCDYLRRLDRKAEAEVAARRLVTTIDGTPAELADLVGWLMERQHWNLVQQLAERFPSEFDLSAPLVYRRAEALLRQGQEKEAEEMASRAFQALPDSPTPHLEMALELRDRGLFPWSEREFRKVMSLASMGDQEELQARYRLAEMLFDLDRFQDAGQTWKEFVDKLDSDPEVRERFGERRQFFRSRMHFFFAQYHAKRGEWSQAREQLDQGIRHDPHDADVLIAMYRLPQADEEWQQRTRALCQECAAHFLELVQKWEAFVDQAPTPDVREEILENLANCCNQYAWLVANTEGDFEAAVRLSHRSVELMPKTASYLDTLGHCYYAIRDYANAVKYQSQAARREPHTRQIHRQLKLFQQALETQRP